MKQHYTDEIIEQYLQGTLDEPSCKALEQRMAEDADFAEEIAIYRTTMDAFWVQQILEDSGQKITADTTFGEISDLERSSILMDLRSIEKELREEGFFEEGVKDLIGLYLAGKLDKEQELAFAEKVKTDEAFAKEVEVQQAIEDAAKVQRIIEEKQAKDANFDASAINETTTFKEINRLDRENIESDLKKVETELKAEQANNQPKDNIRPIRSLPKRLSYFLAAAACISVLIVAVFILPTINSQDSFAANFEPYEDVLTKEVSNKGFAGDQTARLQEGLVFYNKKDYKAALPLFEKQIQDFPKAMDNRKVEFYIANSYLATQEINKAIPILEKLEVGQDFDYQIAARWYLALSYQKVGKQEKAKLLFEKLKMDKTFGKKAEEILNTQ